MLESTLEASSAASSARAIIHIDADCFNTTINGLCVLRAKGTMPQSAINAFIQAMVTHTISPPIPKSREAAAYGKR